MAQGWVSLSVRDDSALWTWAAGLLALTTGSSLLLGFFTPFACILWGLGCAATAFLSSTGYTDNLLHGGLFLLVLVSVAAATALLGPGAYSLDARLFGRREIIIIPQPHGPHHP